MVQLKKHITAVEFLLNELNGPNLVLTGSCVLEAYGINLHRTPADLDIVIYNPTDKQWGVIDAHKDENCAENENIPENYRRVLKLKASSGEVIDVIVERYNQEYSEYLTYKGYNLQPVEDIMKARRRYLRPKDYEAFIQLKNLNFNYV